MFRKRTFGWRQCRRVAVGLALLGALAAEVAGAVSFTLDNQSDVVILRVEASPDYALQWSGEDLLGSAVLGPGNQRRFDVAAQGDHCVFDIRVHWSDSSARSWMGRDLCEDPRVVFDGGDPDPAPGPAQPLTVRTGPPDALIQIMNISPRYQPGIELPSGSYRVRVTAPGFDSVERTLRHGDEPTSVWIGLPFRDCPICPKMVEIPTGRYTMGTGEGPDRDRDEGPAHLVAIQATIAVGVHEVSFEEWDACRRDGGCQRHLADNGRGRGELPVVNATVSDARRYAGWLKERTGRTYRLLSEAEWEYAARAGRPSIRHWAGVENQCAYENGADGTARQEYSDWTVADCNDGFVHAAPGTDEHFRPNPWGLYHMLGNVSEWTEDCWHSSYVGAPNDGSPWGSDCESHGDDDEIKHVARSGSWASTPRGVRASIRFPYDPAEARNDVGFRVAVQITR